MALTPEQKRSGFRLTDRLVLPERNVIHGPGGEAHVEPRAMAVLVCLAEHAGEVVSRDTLHDVVWHGATVTDQALTNCISELRQHLGDDRAGPRFIETVPKRGYRLIVPVEPVSDAAAPTPSRGVLRGSRRALSITGGSLLLAGLIGLALWPWLAPGSSTAQPSVVLLPFENATNREGLDYLRLALPDEITTLLTRSRDLAVRPFESGNHETPANAARQRRADFVVTGHYYRTDSRRLAVAIQAQDMELERLVWRVNVSAPADDFLALRKDIAGHVRHGLVPALGAAAGPERVEPPTIAEAYQLYLRSLALPKHPAPTARAITMLQEAVEIDPGFAPAWSALGLRLYDHGSFGPGGESTLQQAQAALEQSLRLDPGQLTAAKQLIKLQTEMGQLAAAHEQARQLLERFDTSAEAHFALAYVYRFGGLLEASQRHCEIALEHDPHDSRLRSCAYSYLYDGRLQRGRHFLTLDPGSYWTHWADVLFDLREGDDAGALNAAMRVDPDLPTRRLMEPCLRGRRGRELDGPTAAFVQYWQHRRDPEMAYALAPMLAYCERLEEALNFLDRAVDRNFCSHPALDQDPIWHELRDEPAFQRIRSKAIDCRERFCEAIDARVAQCHT